MAGCSNTNPAAVTPTPTGATTAHATDHAQAATPPTAESPTSEPSTTGRPADLADLSQGESYWAVYLVVAPAGDPQLETAHHELESRGYHPSVGELGCDQGAAEQLTPTPDASAYAVRVYFSTKNDAQQFAAQTSPPPVGTAFVQVFCLD